MQLISRLLCLLPEIVTGRLRRKSRREVRAYGKSNRTQAALRYSAIDNWLMWGTAHPLVFVLTAVSGLATVAVLVGLPMFGTASFLSAPSLKLDSDIAAYIGVPWSVQATVVALVYPIVLSFISLLLQRKPASAVLHHVYQLDSAVVPAGFSSLVLLLVMSAEYFFAAFASTHLHQNSVKFLLTLNWGWLTLNICLTGYFVSRTIRFLREEEQENALTRNAVSVLLTELRLAIQQHLHIAAPIRDWGMPEISSEQDAITVINFSIGRGAVQVQRRFRENVVLHDVHLRLLKFVATRWLDRAAGNGGRATLSFAPAIGRAVAENQVLCSIENGPTLTRIERILVKSAFIFKKARPSAPKLTTSGILEELSYDVRTAADARHFDVARRALGRMYELHERLLLACKTGNGDENDSLARMRTSPYGLGTRTLGDYWASSYRELSTVATQSIEDGPRLLQALASIPARISAALPASPKQPILDLMDMAPVIAYELGEWWTRKAKRELTDKQENFTGRLQHPYNQIYEDALTAFIGAWGELRAYPTETADGTLSWPSLAGRAEVYANHIDTSAKFFMKAVSRGDVLAAEWYLDAFMKWWGSRQYELNDGDGVVIEFPHTTISISCKTWDEVEEHYRGYGVAISIEQAEQVLNHALKGYWEAVRLYLTVYLLHNADLAGGPEKLKLASHLILGKALKPGSEVACRPLDSMDTCLSTLLELTCGFGSPRHRLDAISDSLREGPKVSGWMYGWSGSPLSLHSMRPAAVALLLSLRPRGAAELSKSARVVCGWWRDISQLDSAATVASEVRKQVLSGGRSAFEPVVTELRGLLGTAARTRSSRHQLAMLAKTIRKTARHEQLITIRATPVDEAKIKELTAKLSAVAFDSERWVRDFGVELVFSQSSSAEENHFSLQDRKSRYFHTAEVVDEKSHSAVAERIQDLALRSLVKARLKSFGALPIPAPAGKSAYEASAAEAQSFLVQVIEKCKGVEEQGQIPIIVAGRGSCSSYFEDYRWGQESWQHRLPEGISLERRSENSPTRERARLNGFAVLRVPTPGGGCFVIPSTLIQCYEVFGSEPASVLYSHFELQNDTELIVRFGWKT